MFVVDFITVILLAVAFTILFAGALRARGYRGWRQLPGCLWVLAVVSWIGGMFLVAYSAMGAHWVPFALAALALGAMVYGLLAGGRFRDPAHTETGEPGHDARPAIALYFCVTLLLFFCAISLRFYLVNLS